MTLSRTIDDFYYSADGKLLEIGYIQGTAKEKHYIVIMNVMGDVTALYTADGTYVGGYEYDPYGAVIAVNHNPDYADADGILEKNPFCYRGYYLDEETGWYYLNSRYYDPEVKRFINSDRAFESILTNACVNLNQYNLFAYCNDNPIGSYDPDGDVAIADDFVVGLALAIVSVYCILLVKNNKVEVIADEICEYTKLLDNIANILIEISKSDASKDIDDEPNRKQETKKKVIGKSGKEAATNVPSWAKGEAPYVGESGKNFAKRLCDRKYGQGNYKRGPGSEYNKIKKWGDRGVK